MTKRKKITWGIVLLVVALMTNLLLHVITKKGIVLLVVVALGVFVSLRWHIWFGNPPEPPYTSAPEPHRIMLTMGNGGEDSRMVTWQADTMVRQSELVLITPGNPQPQTFRAVGEVVKSRSGQTAFYRVELKDLKHQAADYQYYVQTAGKKSATYHFNIPAIGTASSFILMGDVQDSAKGLSHQIFQEIQTANPDVDFWLFGGDFVERPIDDYWQLAFDDLDSVATLKPVLSISGNHEYLKGFHGVLDARMGYVFGYYQQSKVGNNHVYSFSYRGARFFLLDSNADAWQLVAQHYWLKEQLENSNEKWKIVVLHHPLHSNKGEYYNPLIKWAFKSLVEDSGVDLVLQGHEHVYARWNAKDDGGAAVAPLYVASYCSPKQYQMHFKQPEDRLGTNDRFYQRISFNADSLWMCTYTASNNQLYDQVCVTKGQDGFSVKDYFKGKPQKVEVSDWFRKNKKKYLKEYEQDIANWQKSQK